MIDSNLQGTNSFKQTFLDGAANAHDFAGSLHLGA